jgi:hypothetical protein
MQIVILLLFFGISCSTKKTPPPPENLKRFKELQRRHAPLYRACREHRTNILEQAIVEIPESIGEEDRYVFVPNESDAEYFVNNFNLKLFSLVENQLEIQQSINLCLNGENITYALCETTIPAYKYFRGLFYAMKYNNWSLPLIKVGRNNFLSYLQYVAQSKSSLMEVLVANKLLLQFIEDGFISPSFKKEGLKFSQRAQAQLAQLQTRVKKIEDKRLDCDETKSIYAQEHAKVKALSLEYAKFVALLIQSHKS